MTTCTFLNLCGDVTIQFDEQNKEHVLSIIKKKMDEGYVFFTTKKYLFGKITVKSKIQKRDLSKGRLKDVIITDEQLNKMVEAMNDPDLAKLVTDGSVTISKPPKNKSMEIMSRIDDPREVLKADSVAIRPLRGG